MCKGIPITEKDVDIVWSFLIKVSILLIDGEPITILLLQAFVFKSKIVLKIFNKLLSLKLLSFYY